MKVKPMSQNDEILKALKKGRKINPMIALSEWNCFRLAARIEELRKTYDISTTMVKSLSGKRYAQYELVK